MLSVADMHMSLTQQQLKSLAIAAGGLALAFASYWWLAQPSSDGAATEMSSINVSPTDDSLGNLALNSVVIVDVEGAVVSPGVVELPVGARVQDAVAAAGGLKPGARAGLNLARVLEDGEQLVVGQSAAEAAASDGRVAINSATQAQLEELPGVGPVLAARLVAYREEHGGFRNLGALDAVSGVGPAMLENLKAAIRFD